MTRRFPRSLVLSLCALASGAVALAPLWQAAAYVRAEDRNGDGRPDIWRTYDRLGRVSDVTVDTNFDGRSDVHEYYERGALVRRESDRDFNDRIDLVQEFDPTTLEQVRSIVDTDFDGTADLLVLFQDGKPVFSTSAHLVAPLAMNAGAAPDAGAWPRAARGQLVPLKNPFRGDLAVQAGHAGAGFDVTAGTACRFGLDHPPRAGIGQQGRQHGMVQLVAATHRAVGAEQRQTSQG